ncbi:MAG: flagellar biosynthetic protein FliR [Pseudomonadota bacterium]
MENDDALDALGDLFGRIAANLGFAEESVWVALAVFVRVGAVSAMLPGFGEQVLPARLKLAAAVAFTAAIWPAAAPLAAPAAEAASRSIGGVVGLIASEAVIGLILGLGVRLMVMALQIAGSIAAQSTAVAQVLGANATPDPMPAIGAILTLGGIALAMAAGLHVKAAAMLIGSYAALPAGATPLAGDAAAWATSRAGHILGLAFALAAPFAAASFVYNLALGAINRAMPALMVAFVGAPAITAGALLLLWAAAPEMLTRWSEALDIALIDPFGPGG